MAKLRTESFAAVGANIRGTPAMPAKKVAEDIRVIKRRSDVAVLQEFKWGWYWRVAAMVLLRSPDPKKDWASSPAYKIGRKQPVSGAQAVIWPRNRWKRIDVRKVILHRGHAGISEHRYIRAALLEDRVTGLRCWFLTTHFVVGGDEAGDGKLRQEILEQDIERLDAFLTMLERNGAPIWAQLDANIHKGAKAYQPFIKMLEKHKAKIHGVHGVEYVFTVPGDLSRVVVTKNWVILPKHRGGVLNTDHEARGTDAYIEQL